MNAIPFLAAQPWVERLGETLLHFLWQGLLIAALYAAIRKWTTGPAARYSLACGALAVMFAAPFITWNLLLPAEPTRAPISSGVGALVTAPAAAATSGTLHVVLPAALPAPILPWVVTLWFTGAAIFCIRLCGGWVWAVRLRSRGVCPAPGEWQQTLDRLKTSLRVSRPVRLLVSSLVQTPAVVGWLRPIVLVPLGALAGLPADQMEALLLHELAHIRRHDYLVNILQTAVEALLFYHPAVWWISGHIRAEREQCCDDVAVSANGDVLTYVRALAEVASARRTMPGNAMAANGGSVSRRIARLLGQTRPDSSAVSGPGIAAAALLLLITGFAVFGQPAERPKFEVASIKPSEEQGLMGMRLLPGQLKANGPVRLLMQIVYAVEPFQITGGPDWIGSDPYEIDAKPSGEASRAQMLLMMQSLLENRFQLKVHRETKQLPVYTLTAARGGTKLSSSKGGSCVKAAVERPLDSLPGSRVPPPDPAQRPLPTCGGVNMQLTGSGGRLFGGDVTMGEFIRALSVTLGRTVIDKTGFTGLFDVQLNFVPDETTAALPPPPPGAQLDGNNPSILVALQEQLGLRLESTKGPVETIVIDRVERPSAN